ncbi:MAG: hypothetical protein KKA90_03660 [Nanoarchaeota archaeon]|nr:hypothetical protein [Nanoarchaeota archaeon]
MRIFVLLGLIVIFLSSYFTFFVFDNIVSGYIDCFKEVDAITCDIKAAGINMIGGLFIIGCFAMTAMTVVYVLIKHVIFPSNPYGSPGL